LAEPHKKCLDFFPSLIRDFSNFACLIDGHDGIDLLLSIKKIGSSLFCVGVTD